MGAVLSTVCNVLNITRDKVKSIVQALRDEERRADHMTGALVGTGGFALVLGLTGTLGPIGAVLGAVAVVGGVAAHKTSREFVINGVKYTVEMIKKAGKCIFNVVFGSNGYVNSS